MSALIVEDNPDVAQVLADILTLYGWEVHIAPTPTVALLALRREIPALILLDFNLPGANGVDVLQYIKSAPLAKDVEVVFVSAENSPDTIERALASGARDYLVKPVDIDRLGEVLNSLPPIHRQVSGDCTGAAPAKRRISVTSAHSRFPCES